MGGHVFYVTNTFHDSALSEELLGKLSSILRLSSHWWLFMTKQVLGQLQTPWVMVGLQTQTDVFSLVKWLHYFTDREKQLAG